MTYKVIFPGKFQRFGFVIEDSRENCDLIVILKKNWYNIIFHCGLKRLCDRNKNFKSRYFGLVLENMGKADKCQSAAVRIGILRFPLNLDFSFIKI